MADRGLIADVNRGAVWRLVTDGNAPPQEVIQR